MHPWQEKLQTVTRGRSPAHVLSNACRALGIDARRIAEIGVYEGANARRMRELFRPSRFFLIDPWTVTKRTGPYNEKYLAPGAWGELYARICEEFSGPEMTILRAMSAEAARLLENETLDLCYIDGDHRREFVRRDVELYYPKVKPGGILAGHDFSGAVRAKTENNVREVVLERFGWANIWTGKHRVWLHVKPS